jgi:integrase/recombinase XerC
MVSVDELLVMYLDSHASAGHSAGTIGWYRYELQRFFAWLQACGLHRSDWLQLAVVERYLASSREAGNAPATVAGHWRALRGFFGWLAERGYIAASPLAGAKPPKVPKKAPRRAVLGEYLQLLESIPEGDWIDLRDRLIISTLFLCGVRLGECAKLTSADYRTSEHLLRVREGKGGHERLVPLLPAVERSYVAYLFVCPPWAAGPLFLSANGAREPRGVILANGIRQMLRRRCRRAGLRMLNPHSFRHGLAMHLLNSGGDMSLVQKVLGHAQITTTARHYAEWLTEGMLREFTEKMHGTGL